MNAYGRKGCEIERLYTNACGEERKNRPQMPVAKKERPNHKCWWQTKIGCRNQASKQLTPNERNKQLKPPQNTNRLPTCKLKVEEKRRRKNTPPNHNSLIDYCLQQRSGRLQSEEHRAKITVPLTNRWKAKLTMTLTNPSLTWLPSRKTKAVD